MTNDETKGGESSTATYAAAWRWHFYAAALVVPFVVFQSLTGAIYLFKPEIDPLGHSDKYYVQAGGTPISYDKQLEAVRAALPSHRVMAVDIQPDPNRSTTFLAADPEKLRYSAYVNPYNGEFLGTVKEENRVTEFAKRIHGTLLMGNPGSVVVELAASWTLVMIVTGLYLWWPRGKFSIWGNLIPRLGAKGRLFWKDLHKTAGVWFSLFVIGFIVTGLPWAILWGAMLKQVQGAIGQTPPVLEVVEEEHHPGAGSPQAGHAGHEGHAGHAGHTGAQQIGLQAAVDFAKTEHTEDPIRIALPREAKGFYGVLNVAPRTRDRRTIRLDAQTGKVIARRGWSDFPIMAKIINDGIDLHEGRFFGFPNQIINLIIALTLIWMGVTGFFMWWRRRPTGELAAPPKPKWERWPAGVGVIACVLAVFLPMVGISILLFLFFDRLIIPRLSWLRASAS